MLPRVAYWILFFHILLLTSGHARAIRDVSANREHFRKNLKEVIANKSVRLYYKILNELFKRPAPLPPGYPSPPGPGSAGPGLPGKAVQFENFVLDFVESSYIGLFTPNDVYFGKA
ncbi:uncharacterized protein LOC126688362 [Mercurialis annua]|uniref:uncharacterized protein LOC126688362 n=1 Tax=Mercurialis annua TaxID=3986 RepID=UPI00215FE8EF|nr:uncharacterized protein LOC126688362 [Mercurialis annua]